MKTFDPQDLLASIRLLPMAGKRMLDWQLEAMVQSQNIGEIYLLGLSPEEYPSDLDLQEDYLRLTEYIKMTKIETR